MAQTHRFFAGNSHVYEVHWTPDDEEVKMVDCGLAWAPVTNGETMHIGRASTMPEAIQKCEAAVYETLDPYDKYVMGATMGRSLVIHAHLLLEHLLVRCLHVVLPNPDALFRNRTVSFSMLVSLCEAHRAIDSDLSRILRIVNGIRNKCAHKLVYHLSDSELGDMRRALRKSHPDESQAAGDDEGDCLRSICKLLEERAAELGATDI